MYIHRPNCKRSSKSIYKFVKSACYLIPMIWKKEKAYIYSSSLPAFWNFWRLTWYFLQDKYSKTLYICIARLLDTYIPDGFGIRAHFQHIHNLGETDFHLNPPTYFWVLKRNVLVVISSIMRFYPQICLGSVLSWCAHCGLLFWWSTDSFCTGLIAEFVFSLCNTIFLLEIIHCYIPL